MRAEYVACFEAIGQAVWLKNFIMVGNISEPLLLYCDNQPAVFYSSNNKSSVSTKHIDIKYHVVKDRV
jgi:hypothetical protein